MVQDTKVTADTFTVQIRMPCIEVLSEIPSGLSIRSSNPRMLCKHFKTTVAHFVTGKQMLAMI